MYDIRSLTLPANQGYSRFTKNDMGPLIIISGPAGSGKTTVVAELLKTTRLPLRRAITATTRPPRHGEIDGKDYHSGLGSNSNGRSPTAVCSNMRWSTSAIITARRARKWIEYRKKNIGVLLVIDVQGADQIRRAVSGLFFRLSPHSRRLLRRAFDRSRRRSGSDCQAHGFRPVGTRNASANTMLS